MYEWTLFLPFSLKRKHNIWNKCCPTCSRYIIFFRWNFHSFWQHSTLPQTDRKYFPLAKFILLGSRPLDRTTQQARLIGPFTHKPAGKTQRPRLLPLCYYKKKAWRFARAKTVEDWKPIFFIRRVVSPPSDCLLGVRLPCNLGQDMLMVKYVCNNCRISVKVLLVQSVIIFHLLITSSPDQVFVILRIKTRSNQSCCVRHQSHFFLIWSLLSAFH